MKRIRSPSDGKRLDDEQGYPREKKRSVNVDCNGDGRVEFGNAEM